MRKTIQNDEEKEPRARIQSESCALKFLDLSFNNVKPRAALCLAASIKRNEGLRSVNLDGNPVGRIGARSLMGALQGCGHDLALSLRQCDTTSEDKALFDADQPGGKYRLDMAVPYDRVVCLELVQIATLRDHAQFAELRHYAVGEALPLIDAEVKTGGREITLSRADAKGKEPTKSALTPSPTTFEGSPLGARVPFARVTLSPTVGTLDEVPAR